MSRQKNERLRRAEVRPRVEVPSDNGANASEPTIGMWSVSEWQRIVRRNDEWSVVLDNIGADMIDQIIGICRDSDAEVRFLGATLLRHVGSFGLSRADRVDETLAVLEMLSRDRRRKTRAIALQACDEIMEHQEEARARQELPWIRNYEENYVPQALALLEEDRPPIHRCLYFWLAEGAQRNGLPETAVAKLKQHAKTRRDAREVCDLLRLR